MHFRTIASIFIIAAAPILAYPGEHAYNTQTLSTTNEGTISARALAIALLDELTERSEQIPRSLNPGRGWHQYERRQPVAPGQQGGDPRTPEQLALLRMMEQRAREAQTERDRRAAESHRRQEERVRGALAAAGVTPPAQQGQQGGQQGGR